MLPEVHPLPMKGIDQRPPTRIQETPTNFACLSNACRDPTLSQDLFALYRVYPSLRSCRNLQQKPPKRSLGVCSMFSENTPECLKSLNFKLCWGISRVSEVLSDFAVRGSWGQRLFGVSWGRGPRPQQVHWGLRSESKGSQPGAWRFTSLRLFQALQS